MLLGAVLFGSVLTSTGRPLKLARVVRDMFVKSLSGMRNRSSAIPTPSRRASDKAR